MNGAVTVSGDGTVAVITLNAPPVNALSRAVREGLIAAFEQVQADRATPAAVLICSGRNFSAGADIAEFDTVPQGATFSDLQNAMDAMTKPLVAAIHGTALGGGLEIAMRAHYRVAVPSARLGLPEVNLGLVPGAGGTQLLPRLVGVPTALEMITSGKPVSAKDALASGLVDALAPEGALKSFALAFASRLLAEGKGVRRTRDQDSKLAAPAGLFEKFRSGMKKTGFLAPAAAIDCVEAATRLLFEKGLAFERETFESLKTSPQSMAQRHAFFAERRAAKIPDIAEGTPSVPITKVGVIGAGLMGGGIAMNFANSGIPVIIVERDAEALAKGLGVVKANFDTSAKHGRFTPEDAARRFGLLTGTWQMNDLADCDLIIEAVFERMDIKKDIFARLDAIAKPGAILATNTSRLNIDEIAASISRPEAVLGLHFFSPANVMKLLEVVRGEKTAPAVINTAMKLARTIGKVAVVVRVGPGFVGNRMLARRSSEAQKLILAGAMPWDVDRVLTSFGFPMGPFAMADLVGLDLFWSKAESRGATVLEKLCEMDRRGQKTGAGYYDYDAGRKPSPSPLTENIIRDLMASNGLNARKISDQEIVERCIYSMINEGANILNEGKAQRASDIDVVWLHGYGWPAWRGGPMYYADSIGLATILEGVRKHGWTPSPLLENLAAEKKRFADLPG
jgi:3-hydroxyacyl-CoA dehydrogenase